MREGEKKIDDRPEIEADPLIKMMEEYDMGEIRRILKNVGNIDPVSTKEYSAAGGYEGLKVALTSVESIIKTISASGLRGRGGGGFSVGLKWQAAKETQADIKYIICNAGESEPATEKDRLIMCGDPHAVIEGMAICGVAIGAEKGIIYTRSEYTQACKILEKAILDARENGYLGTGILGSISNFDIELRQGHSTYICGEETGLLETLEGNRGEPRLKPPYPVVSGLWGKPTVINNVETLANVPFIMRVGADEYREFGTEKSPGTKLFTLSGDISRPGVYEFPMGVTIRQLFDEAGGCPNGKVLKGVQVGGGASGAFVVTEMLNTPLDMESYASAGMDLGTGSLRFFDEDADVIALCHDCMAFLADESCGKCTPCRLGNRLIADILENLASGKGTMADLDTLEELSDYVTRNALCGLGLAVSVPVLSTLRYFRDDYVKACAGPEE